MGRAHSQSRAVFLDRDGTLIREKNYLRYVKDIRLLGGAASALGLLRDSGFKLVLITNQSGIARGYFTEEKLTQIHERLQQMLRRTGVELDAIYYCPHGPDDRCSCRKPRLGLIRKAQKELHIDLRRSYSIGDKTGDFLMGQDMGGKGVFVLTGHGAREQEKIRASDGKMEPDYVARNLPAAAHWIVDDARDGNVPETRKMHGKSSNRTRKKSRQP